MYDLKVWSRSGANKLSKASFSLLLSLFTALGIGFCLWMSTFTDHVDLADYGGWTIFGFCVAVIVSGIVGIIIADRSENPFVSTLGFALVAGPMGLLLGPAIAQYDPELVLAVGIETTVLVVALGLVGGLIKKDLSGWGNWLFGGLIILLIGMFSIPFLSLFGLSVDSAYYWWNWAGILLFGAMVIFDVNKAMRVPRTVDNAVDCAVGLFLDWINLFIRLLANQRS